MAFYVFFSVCRCFQLVICCSVPGIQSLEHNSSIWVEVSIELRMSDAENSREKKNIFIFWKFVRVQFSLFSSRFSTEVHRVSLTHHTAFASFITLSHRAMCVCFSFQFSSFRLLRSFVIIRFENVKCIICCLFKMLTKFIWLLVQDRLHHFASFGSHRGRPREWKKERESKSEAMSCRMTPIYIYVFRIAFQSHAEWLNTKTRMRQKSKQKNKNEKKMLRVGLDNVMSRRLNSKFGWWPNNIMALAVFVHTTAQRERKRDNKSKAMRKKRRKNVRRKSILLSGVVRIRRQNAVNGMKIIDDDKKHNIHKKTTNEKRKMKNKSGKRMREKKRKTTKTRSLHSSETEINENI